jgi:hypothetical protein
MASSALLARRSVVFSDRLRGMFVSAPVSSWSKASFNPSGEKFDIKRRRWWPTRDSLSQGGLIDLLDTSYAERMAGRPPLGASLAATPPLMLVPFRRSRERRSSLPPTVGDVRGPARLYSRCRARRRRDGCSSNIIPGTYIHTVFHTYIYHKYIASSFRRSGACII